MQLKTTEIKRFISNASMIKSSGILPVLDYLLIQDDKIIKTNLEAFISMDIQPTGETLLVDENILSSLIKKTTADVIDIKVKGSIVHLTDGVYKPYFTFCDHKDYPVFPESDKDSEMLLPEPVLKSIKIASKNIGSGGDSFDFVHLSDGYVFGADHFRFYFKKFDELPKLSMSSLCANIISQFGTATYYKKGNFDFYSIGTLLYGFLMQEVVIPDFPTFLTFIEKGEYLEVDVSQVTDFLEFLSSTTSSATVTCDFEGNKLSFNDVDLQVGNDVQLSTTGKYQLKKSFLPRVLGPFLKSLGKDFIRFSPMKGGRKGITVWSEDEPEFTGMIGEVSNQ